VVYLLNWAVNEMERRYDSLAKYHVRDLASYNEMCIAKKKEQEAEDIVDALRRTTFDCKLNKTTGDEMFMNAAFLVDKGREKEFDNIMDDLNQVCKDRIKFAYAGPLPVYNFVTIEIHPEQWEK